MNADDADFLGEQAVGGGSVIQEISLYSEATLEKEQAERRRSFRSALATRQWHPVRMITS
jgi:hypothetical protein